MDCISFPTGEDMVSARFGVFSNEWMIKELFFFGADGSIPQ